MPQSINLTLNVPSLCLSSTFSGLMSLCAKPSECVYFRALRISYVILAAICSFSLSFLSIGIGTSQSHRTDCCLRRARWWCSSMTSPRRISKFWECWCGLISSISRSTRMLRISHSPISGCTSGPALSSVLCGTLCARFQSCLRLSYLKSSSLLRVGFFCTPPGFRATNLWLLCLETECLCFGGQTRGPSQWFWACGCCGSFWLILLLWGNIQHHNPRFFWNCS